MEKPLRRVEAVKGGPTVQIRNGMSLKFKSV